jgi:ABC-2 type transport system ATP-binding protein
MATERALDTAAAVSVVGLTKRFGSVTALDRLDLEVRTGEVHGFLGPNGAGKSTLLRLLLALLRPDAGRARVLGLDPWTETAALHRRIAYVPGDVALWPTLTGGETIDVLTRFRGGGSASRRAELTAAFELDESRRCRAYSKGNRQKVALVAALACDAELLLLDEPTSGLDPLMERVFAEQVNAQRARGRTVLLSSHILSEVERLCERVSIIRAGRIVEVGTLEDMRALHQVHVRAGLRGPAPGLTEVRGVHGVSLADGVLHCTVDPPAIDALMAVLSTAGIVSLEVTPPSLEDLFLGFYGQRTAEAG